MEEKTSYTVVGLVVVILIGTLIAAGLWLSVGLDQKQYKTYLVYIREAVSGLAEQAPVKFNGVRVGFVRKIALNRKDPQQVELILNIEEGTPITTSTNATLISQGITGTTYVGLSATAPDLTPLQRKPNESYPVIPSKPSIFNQLDTVLKEVSENVNKVSKKINLIFDNENAAYIKKSLANINKFTDVIAQNNQKINHSLKNSDILLQNVAEASHEFPDMVKSLRRGLDKMYTMADTITDAGKSVTSTMKVGKVAIDKISQQAIPSAVTLLERLDTIAANLEKVSIQMRQNPAVIIRGTTQASPGPGE